MPRFSTLVPIGPEALLRSDVLAPAAGVLPNRTVALFDEPAAGADPETQRFGQFGRPLGPRVDLGPLENPDGGGVSHSLIEPLRGGGYVAGWLESFSQATDSRYAVIGPDDRLLVSTTFGNSGRVSGLAATDLPGGGFALLETVSGIFGESAALHFQRFTAQGAPIGQPLTLAAQSGGAGTLSYSDPQALALNGATELLWIARDGVHAGRLAADNSFQSQLLDAGQAADLDAVRLNDGRVVATWAEPNGFDAFVMAAVFDPAHPDQARVFKVGDADAFASATDPELAALKSGGWAVSWHDGQADGSTTARTFGPTGDASPEFHARGDFIGTDAFGRVLAMRVDPDGDVFLSRYFELSLPFFIPGLDVVHQPQSALAAAQEWAL
ncbi:hypothetical protein [Caulobacter sp. 17J80-11]|uniref:hypothetical protein n=1 Tax=Caulobacter sp. 17J80-11 TaxID=2763502 RepID=UPI001653759F|nr:hypothetical protein [Caulobacter sp. 17J80-11]MBC6982079.1 hypothetical protein [Caulobacter sp. 17J80-11]